MRKFLIIISLFVFIKCGKVINEAQPPDFIMNIPGYPAVFEMNRGEIAEVGGETNPASRSATIRLVDYQLHFENNSWFSNDLPAKNVYLADVFVEINGKPDTLYKRAYQSPELIEGYRWHIEAIAEWDSVSRVDPVSNMKKEVRIAFQDRGESWAPEGWRYPVNDYLWRSSSYMNSWSSLVPYNLLYYHRGEDIGAVPDVLDVMSMFGGEIIKSPFPNGDGASNRLAIKNNAGITVEYSHMNSESVLPSSSDGMKTLPGQVLGKTGETWNGKKSQHMDPHVHIELNYREIQLGSFPYLMETYFRDYPDKVLAVAGGYRFGNAGDTIELDGSRSLAAEGETIQSISWVTHSGDTLEGSQHEIVYHQTGLYSEQLLVETASGETDRDFLQVRIFDPSGNSREVVYGWVYFTPVRGIHPGTEVRFWNRLVNNTEPVTVDFGDGSRPEIIVEELKHIYKAMGKYVVTFSTFGNEEEACVQVEVVVV